MNLTLSERLLIVNALAAVSPSGGGSAAYTLCRRLCAELNVEPGDAVVIALQLRVTREIRDNAPDSFAAIVAGRDE